MNTGKMYCAFIGFLLGILFTVLVCVGLPVTFTQDAEQKTVDRINGKLIITIGYDPQQNVDFIQQARTYSSTSAKPLGGATDHRILWTWKDPEDAKAVQDHMQRYIGSFRKEQINVSDSPVGK
jgi:hypothetical protein